MTDSNNPRGIKMTPFDTSVDEKQWAMVKKTAPRSTRYRRFGNSFAELPAKGIGERQ